MRREDREVWFVVRSLVRRYAVLFGLELRKVKPLKRKHAKKMYGYCTDKGTVAIGIRDHGEKKLYNAYRIMETIAHELAHVKHWNHGPEWFALYGQILARMGQDKDLYKRLKKLC